MTSISKNVYIDKLDNIVNKCNNTYHRTIKMKPVDVKSNTYIDSSKEKMKMIKILNLTFVILLEYQNTKIFFQTVWSEGVFVIKKVKITVPWTYVINDLNGEEIVETFYEN